MCDFIDRIYSSYYYLMNKIAFDDSEDQSKDLNANNNNKSKEGGEEEDNEEDNEDSPKSKLNMKFLRKQIIDIEKEKREPNYSELIEQRKKEEMKEEEKLKIEKEEKNDKEKKAPSGSINSNNKMKEDYYLLPQNVVNATPIESHSRHTSPNEITISSSTTSSLSYSNTSNNENSKDKKSLEIQFDEFMKTQTYILFYILFIDGIC